VAVGLGDAIDPVCQASVPMHDAVHVGRWQGRAWYFCGVDCRARFFANPLRYAAFAPGVPGVPERT
jgi:Cu+-exporting ATPase